MGKRTLHRDSGQPSRDTKGGRNAVPTDMKRTIAEAVQVLLLDRHVKKLTVKDIVETCHITRQAFYYHFEGIPELFQWMIDGYFEQVMGKAISEKDGEAGLRCFFTMAINAAPYVERSMRSNYGPEFRRLLRQGFRRYFALASQQSKLYAGYSHAQLQILQRYHCQAILGLLEEWTDADTEQLDQIVHTVYHIMTTPLPPWEMRVP